MSLVVLPRQYIADGDGEPRSGAKASFFQAGTTTPIVTYTTSAYTSTHPAEVPSLATGLFPAVYINPAVNPTYKLVVADADGVVLYTEDNIPALGFSASDVGALLYPRTAAEISAGAVVVDYLAAPGNVVRYTANAVPGTTDVTTAFQNAALVSLNPYAPAGTYFVTDSIPLRDNQHWKLDGANITIAGNTQVFTVAAGIDDWSIRGVWTVTGDNGAAGATSGTGAALKIIDSERFYVDGPIAKNIKGWGILVQPGSSTSDRAEHGIIHAPQAYACYRGMEIQAGTGAEYITVISPHASRCNVGLLYAAGNTNSIGGSATDNVVGLMIGPGTNHAHGIITGMNVNHNSDFNLHCDNVTNGQTLTGCHFYEGGIFLDESKGIDINGGILDCPIYNYKGASSGLNKIHNMWMPAGGTGTSRQPGTNNGHDELIIENCWGPGAVDTIDGLVINDVSDMHVYAARTGGGGTQSLTTATPADLIFPSEAFDRRAAYNNATGITTIPAAQGGIYRVRANCLFGGTGMDATASFIEVQKNGASVGGSLFFPTINSTTKLQISVDHDIILSATDTVKLRATITGTTPVFGDSASDSFLSVERIA
jgi:hypothetical protein